MIDYDITCLEAWRWPNDVRAEDARKREDRRKVSHACGAIIELDAIIRESIRKHNKRIVGTR